MTTISDRIKILRKSEHLTQKDFSKRLLISQSYLSGLESGNESPTNKLLKLICLEFGVNESWLLNGTDEIYSDVYENDKIGLVETSNSALLKIMSLLATRSNVEYGFYANNLELFAKIMENSLLLDEETRLTFLDLLQNFIMDLERLAYISFSSKLGGNLLESHNNTILSDLKELLQHIETFNGFPKS